MDKGQRKKDLQMPFFVAGRVILLHMPPHFRNHLCQGLHFLEGDLRLFVERCPVLFLKILLHGVIPDGFSGFPALVKSLVAGV